MGWKVNLFDLGSENVLQLIIFWEWKLGIEWFYMLDLLSHDFVDTLHII